MGMVQGRLGGQACGCQQGRRTSERAEGDWAASDWAVGDWAAGGPRRAGPESRPQIPRIRRYRLRGPEDDFATGNPRRNRCARQ